MSFFERTEKRAIEQEARIKEREMEMEARFREMEDRCEERMLLLFANFLARPHSTSPSQYYEHYYNPQESALMPP